MCFDRALSLTHGYIDRKKNARTCDRWVHVIAMNTHHIDHAPATRVSDRVFDNWYFAVYIPLRFSVFLFDILWVHVCVRVCVFPYVCIFRYIYPMCRFVRFYMVESINFVAKGENKLSYANCVQYWKCNIEICILKMVSDLNISIL